MKIVGVQKYNKMEDGTIRTSAVDWWRVINPLNELKRQGEDVDIIKDLNAEKDPDKIYSQLGLKYDILMTSYIDTPKAYAYIRATSHRYNLLHIMDLDDNLYEIDKYNPAYERYHLGTREMFFAHEIIKDVDALIVTNEQLKKVTRRFGRRKPTFVIPNYIDQTVYRMDWSTLNRDKKTINIVYQGSSSHYRDLTESGFLDACQVITSRYKDKVKFTFLGMDYDDIRRAIPTKRLSIVPGRNNFWDWIPLWQQEMAKADITVAPLLDNEFNNCKSPIKFLEGASAKLPMVLSNVPPYNKIVEHNKTGFLVSNDPEDWCEHLTMLIDNKILRHKMGDSAYKYVKENHTIQQHAYKYKKIYEKIFNKK